MRAERLPILSALLLAPALVWGGACDLEPAVDPRDGSAIWRLRDAGSSYGWETRLAEQCRACAGGTLDSKFQGGYRCLRSGNASTGAAAPSTAGADAMAAALAARMAGQPLDPMTESMAMMAGGFQTGVALHNWLEAEAAKGRAQKAAEEARRREEERLRREAEAREREESWQRLNRSLVLDDSAGDLRPKMDYDGAGSGGELELKFDDHHVASPAEAQGPVNGRGIMPTRRQGPPPVQVSRYTPAAPPAKPPKNPPQVAASKPCGWVGLPELIEGEVWYRLHASNCPVDQSCLIEVGETSPRRWPVARGGTQRVNVGRLPSGVSIYDYEKVLRVKKTCTAKG